MHRPDGPAGTAARGHHLRGRPARLTPSERILMEAIGRQSGAINWYQLGRACLGRLASPADFRLGVLLAAGLVEQHPHPGEPLGRLRVTAAGARALAERA